MQEISIISNGEYPMSQKVEMELKLRRFFFGSNSDGEKIDLDPKMYALQMEYLQKKLHNFHIVCTDTALSQSKSFT